MGGSLTLTGLISGMPAGEEVLGPVSVTSAAAVGGVDGRALGSGDNTYTVPTGALHVVIFLPSAVGATVKLRTNLNSGDAGVPITPTTNSDFVKLPLAAGTTSVILNSTGTVSPVQVVFV